MAQPVSNQLPLKIWGLSRINLGLLFLWSFLDKLLGLGFATCAEQSIGCSQAWIQGGSPTTGFLTFSTGGVFANFYQNLAGLLWVDWLFMAGLLGIGLALVLGIGIRIATASGLLMMVILYFANWPPQNNPLIDEHIIYILLLVGLYKTGAQNRLGFGRWWKQTKIVGKYGFLE